MSTATKTKPRRASVKAVRRHKPDMKAWAAFALARLKAHYGDRIVPDSTPLLVEMRADRF